MTSNTNIVYLKCISIGGKLRIRITSNGYINYANCQFPRNLREEGRIYSVPSESITLITSRSKWYYRISNPITIIDSSSESCDDILVNTILPMFKNIKMYDSDDHECVICMDNPIDRVFVPCGHTACGLCSEKLRNKNCHMCRKKILNIILPSQLG